MKSTIPLIFAAAALVFSACQKETASSPSNFPADGVIRVATNLEAPSTYGGMTSDNVRMFSLNIENKADTTYSYFGFFDKSEGSWNGYADAQKLNPLKMLWKNDTQRVTVTALSQDGVSTPRASFAEIQMAVEPIQSEAQYFNASDILYMAPTVINPSTDLTADGKLPITFKHLLSKVTLTITLGTDLNTVPGTATNPISNLKIRNTKRFFKWTPRTNGNVTVIGTETATIVPFAGTYTPGNGSSTGAVANYDVILVPQTIAANSFQVTFTIGGRPYTWTANAAVTLSQGKQHTLAITAGGNTVAASKMIASEWKTALQAK